MTRCSWKKRIASCAGVFLLLALTYAQPVSASNSAVEAEVKAFNQNSVITAPEKAKLLEDLKKAKDQCGISFANAGLWMKVQKFQKWDVSWFARSVEFNTFSDFFKLDKNISTFGNMVDNNWENLESMWSGFLNTMEDIKRQIDKYYTDALRNADDAEAKAAITESYNKIMAEYEELVKATADVRKACELLNTFDSDAMDALTLGNVYKYITCPKDKDGKEDTSKCETVFYTNDGTNTKTLKGNMRGCIPLPVKLAEGKSCIFCPLFKTVFNAAQEMTTKSYNALAQAISNVLLIGFALWVAFSLLGKVSSFTKMDAPKYITELLTQAFKVFVAYLLLRDATSLYEYVIGPLLKAGMEFGMSLLSANGNKYLLACNSKGAMDGLTGGMLPAYLYIQLECFIQAVQAELAVPQSIGSTLMCVAQNAASTDMGYVASLVTDYRLPDFGMLFEGLIIWGFAWLISLAFAFYLIDATVRLGIVGALMPFLIACWPFKLTSKYTTQGFTMFMNTFFTYVFMGLVVSVNIQLMGHSLSGTEGGFEAIIAALNSNEVQVLKDKLNIGFAGFLILIACCIFGFKLTAQATELAGTMAGGGGGQSIAPQIGGMAANVAKAGTLGAAKKGWQGTKFLGNATGITPKARKVRDQALGWVGKKLGFGGSTGGGAPSSGGAPRPAPAPTPTPAPTSTPPATPSQQQQAEQVQNAAPRPAPAPDSGPTPAPTSTHSEQTPKPTPAPTPTHSEQTPKPTPAPTPAEMRNKALKEFETSDAGNAINQAISDQTSRRAEHRQKLDSLRDDQRRASDDVRFFENAARDTKASQDFRDNMRNEANAARQRERAFENEIKAEQAEIKKCDDSLNSLNQLKGNTAEQYANNKVDPKNNQEVNTAEIVNQVNNMTI